MSKRLTDFQLWLAPFGGALPMQRAVNHALFAVSEPTRLWLEAERPVAPFRKLLVTLTDRSALAVDGRVSVALGVCEVQCGVALDVLSEKAVRRPWALGVAKEALESVARRTGWQSHGLEEFLRRAAESEGPLVHRFVELERCCPARNVVFGLWLSFGPGRTVLGVSVLGGDGQRDVSLMSVDGPIFLERDFPVKTAEIESGKYVLRAKDKSILASVGAGEDATPQA